MALVGFGVITLAGLVAYLRCERLSTKAVVLVFWIVYGIYAFGAGV